MSTPGARYLAHERQFGPLELLGEAARKVDGEPATGPIWIRAHMSVETIIALAEICGCTVAEFSARYR